MATPGPAPRGLTSCLIRMRSWTRAASTLGSWPRTSSHSTLASVSARCSERLSCETSPFSLCAGRRCYGGVPLAPPRTPLPGPARTVTSPLLSMRSSMCSSCCFKMSCSTFSFFRGQNVGDGRVSGPALSPPSWHRVAHI